jgi:hypothetical protein
LKRRPSMKVNLTPPVEIALRTLGEEDRQQVRAWLGHLGNWEKDVYVREHAAKLPDDDGVYVLKAGAKFRIFFRLEPNQIEILDIATKATLMSFGDGSGSCRP